MRRLFVLLLTLLLPIQFAWAGAAVYCQHEAEQPTQGQHFGHHRHEHKTADGGGQDARQGSKQNSDQHGKQSVAGKLVVDADCGVCHAAGASLIGAASRLPAAVPLPAPWFAASADPHASAPARAPDRPQWPRLA